MNVQDKQRFGVLMMGMADNFRDTMTEAGLRFRYKALKEYTIDQLEQAAMQIIRNRKYTKMPTVAEFVEAIDGSGADHAELQAHQVLCQIRECGAYRSPVFNDPVTQAIVSRRWTWGSLCTMPITDHQWFVKEFVHAYRNYRRLETVPQLDGPARLKQLASTVFTGPSEA